MTDTTTPSTAPRPDPRPQFDCVACAGERYTAHMTGTADNELPPVNPADVIAGGNSVCYGHIQFGPAPVAPGRTASGLVLPGQGV